MVCGRIKAEGFLPESVGVCLGERCRDVVWRMVLFWYFGIVLNVPVVSN